MKWTTMLGLCVFTMPVMGFVVVVLGKFDPWFKLKENSGKTFVTLTFLAWTLIVATWLVMM